MRKGLVTKVDLDYMLVMTDTMTIERIKPRHEISVGALIEFGKRDIYHGFKSHNFKRLFILTSVFLAVLISVVVNAVQGENQVVYATISVDINPSMEFDIDENGNVIEVRALNSDAKNLELNKLTGSTLEEALQLIMLKAQDKGFLQKDGSVLIASKTLGNQNDETNIKIEAFLAKHKDQFRFAYIVINDEEPLAGNDKSDKSNKISIGRQFIAQSLNINDSDAMSKSVDKMLDELHVYDDLQLNKAIEIIKDNSKLAEKNKVSTKTILNVDSSKEKQTDNRIVDEGNKTEVAIQKEVKEDKKAIIEETKEEQKVNKKDAKDEEKVIKKDAKDDEKAIKKDAKDEEKASKDDPKDVEKVIKDDTKDDVKDIKDDTKDDVKDIKDDTKDDVKDIKDDTKDKD